MKNDGLKEFKKVPTWILNDFGIIKEVKDGVVVVKEGLKNVGMSEMVLFEETGIKGIVNYVGLEKSITVLGNIKELRVGDVVKRLNDLPTLYINNNFLGRVVDPLGTPVDGLGIIKKDEKSKNYNIEKKAPGIIEREAVRDSLETGVKFLDSMIPIGLGQRELIIGDPKTGKTTIAIDTIINQKGKGLICVYVVIGQKQTSLLKILKTLKKKECLDYTVIVMASAADSAVMQFLAPYSGCAIGEYFMSKGRDVLIVYDDLSKHAVAYRQMSLLLKRPPGREGYPGDVWATVRLYLCMLFFLYNNKLNYRYLNTKSRNKKVVRYYSTFIKAKDKVHQFVKGFYMLNEALNVFDKANNLKLIDRLSILLFFAGFINFTLCLTDISLIFSPFYLALISIIEYIFGLLLVGYTCVRRLYFIYNFKLECNTKF